MGNHGCIQPAKSANAEPQCRLPGHLMVKPFVSGQLLIRRTPESQCYRYEKKKKKIRMSAHKDRAWNRDQASGCYTKIRDRWTRKCCRCLRAHMKICEVSTLLFRQTRPPMTKPSQCLLSNWLSLYCGIIIQNFQTPTSSYNFSFHALLIRSLQINSTLTPY